MRGCPAEIPLSNCLCTPSWKCWVETRDGEQGCLARPCSSSWALSLQDELVLLAICFFRPLPTLAGSSPVSHSPCPCWGPPRALQRADGSEAVRRDAKAGELCLGCSLIWTAEDLLWASWAQRGASEWQHLLLGEGRKKPFYFGLLAKCGSLNRSSVPGGTHPALFCVHLLSSAGCRLPGVLAAEPAPLGPGGAAAAGRGRQG